MKINKTQHHSSCYTHTHTDTHTPRYLLKCHWPLSMWMNWMWGKNIRKCVFFLSLDYWVHQVPLCQVAKGLSFLMLTLSTVNARRRRRNNTHTHTSFNKTYYCSFGLKTWRCRLLCTHFRAHGSSFSVFLGVLSIDFSPIEGIMLSPKTVGKLFWIQAFRR